MCTAFSQWQRLNHAKSTNKAALEHARAQAVSHMNFVFSLYEEQVDGGRYFLHEHPRYADSWDFECVQRFSAVPEVQRSEYTATSASLELRSRVGASRDTRPRSPQDSSPTRPNWPRP